MSGPERVPSPEPTSCDFYNQNGCPWPADHVGACPEPIAGRVTTPCQGRERHPGTALWHRCTRIEGHGHEGDHLDETTGRRWVSGRVPSVEIPREVAEALLACHDEGCYDGDPAWDAPMRALREALSAPARGTS
jgi:hypothetical protein